MGYIATRDEAEAQQAAQEFADALLERFSADEMPTIRTWLQAIGARDLLKALRDRD